MRLDEACTLIVDCEHKTAPAARVGTPCIGTPDIRNGRIDFEGSKKVSAEAYAEWTKRATPEGGDLIMAREAPVGEVGYVPADQPACLGQRTVLLRPSRRVVNPRYLHYLLLSPVCQASLRSLSEGSTVPHLNVADIRRFELGTLPDLTMQEAIAEVLGALDDKIDLNRRTVATTKMLRRSMVDLALEGRESATPLSSLADFVNGRAFTAQADGSGRPILRIRELNSGIDLSTLRISRSVPDDHLAEPDSLLLAWSGSLGSYRWHGPEAVINQHIFKVIPKVPAWLVEYWCERHVVWFKNIAADKATTMGHIQRHHLDEARCALPDSGSLDRLGAQVGPMYELEHSLAVESARLGELRDALLPELISGRMTVKEAAAAV